MYCIKKVTNDLTWVGGNDRRLAMFEGVYSVPDGVSYNSYLLTDDMTVLFDTVDASISKLFFENVDHVLAGRKLNFVIVQHMEPDHAATLEELVLRHPEVTVVCNEKTAKMIKQFFTFNLDDRCWIVDESSVLKTANHEFHFVFAPMVHWPEVMVTYDAVTKTLFSADAFGTFGALNGAIFADEVDFNHDYMDEARRYYCNIVGKYGPQVQALLGKASSLEINMVCPLHGFVWRKNIGDFIDKYLKWSSYTPEEPGVMIAYASIYGNTANVAEIIAARLRDKGIKAVVYDVSVTPSSDIIAAAFRWSHLVFASATYNAGIFISMDDLLRDIAAHNLQNRTVALVENGSWAPAAGGLMKEILSSCKNMNILNETLTVLSSLKDDQMEALETLVDAIAKTVPVKQITEETEEVVRGTVDANAMFKLSYGLFVLSAQENGKDNGCIVNTVAQLTDTPKRITVAVNKQNLTHDMILRTGKLNVSVLTESVPFKVFENFGFRSGRDADKFEGLTGVERSANGLAYLTENTNALISATVIEAQDYGTHTLFVADVTEAKVLSDEPSVTYAYYFANIKPKPQAAGKKKGYVCKICGFVYEGEELPADYVCPLCKHGAEDFEPLS